MLKVLFAPSQAVSTVLYCLEDSVLECFHTADWPHSELQSMQQANKSIWHVYSHWLLF